MFLDNLQFDTDWSHTNLMHTALMVSFDGSSWVPVEDIFYDWLAYEKSWYHWKEIEDIISQYKELLDCFGYDTYPEHWKELRIANTRKPKFQHIFTGETI